MARKFPRSYDAVILDRRRVVASMRLRGLTMREIEKGLPEVRCVNPEDGKPWSVATICSDLKAIEKEWKEQAVSDIAQYRANLNAELEELKRVSWSKGDPYAVLRVIEQQRKMLGLDTPAPAGGDDDVPPPVRVVVEVKDASVASPEQAAG